MLLLALTEAQTSTIVSILIWVILFPAFVTGLIVYAIIVARGEKTENDEQRRYPRL